jgi:hypothetical protein
MSSIGFKKSVTSSMAWSCHSELPYLLFSIVFYISRSSGLTRASTAWSRSLHEYLSSLCGKTRSFIITFIRSRCWNPPWANFNPIRTLKLCLRVRPILILYHLPSILSKSAYPSSFPTKIAYEFLSQIRVTCRWRLILLYNTCQLNNSVHSIQLFIAYMPSQQIQGQLQKHRNVDTNNYTTEKDNSQKVTFGNSAMDEVIFLLYTT